MQISIESWTHTVHVKNLVLGNVGCYMWLLKEGVLQSLDVDGHLALPPLEFMMLEQFSLFCLALPCK